MKKVLVFLTPIFITILIFLISLVVMLTFKSLFSLPDYTDVRNVKFVYTMIITASITVIGVVLAYRYVHKTKFKEMGFGWNKETSILTLIISFITILGFFIFIIYAINSNWVSLKEKVEITPMIFLILLYVGVSINEEVLFRGYLHRFYKSYHILIAYFISIPLFFLPHFLNRGFELSYIIALLSATVLITLLYDVSKSIWPSIIIHTLLNISLSIISGGDNSGSIVTFLPTANINDYNELIRYSEVFINFFSIICIFAIILLIKRKFAKTKE